MSNKRSKSKKPKQSKDKMTGKKGGRAEMDEFGSPQPVRKQKKK